MPKEATGVSAVASKYPAGQGGRGQSTGSTNPTDQTRGRTRSGSTADVTSVPPAPPTTAVANSVPPSVASVAECSVTSVPPATPTTAVANAVPPATQTSTASVPLATTTAAADTFGPPGTSHKMAKRMRYQENQLKIMNEKLANLEKRVAESEEKQKRKEKEEEKEELIKQLRLELMASAPYYRQSQAPTPVPTYLRPPPTRHTTQSYHPPAEPETGVNLAPQYMLKN